MSATPARILTALQPDDPLVQDADYQFDATDRQWIDTRQRAVERHLADGVLNSVIATWIDLDPSSPAVVEGDVLCSAATITGTATLATSAALAISGTALGVVLQAASPGSKARYAYNGLIAPAVTGLAATAGFARVSTAGAVEYVGGFAAGDFALGSVDSAGNLAMAITGANAIPVSGGIVAPTPSTLVRRGTSGEGYFAFTAPTQTGIASTGLVRADDSAQDAIAQTSSVDPANDIVAVGFDGADGVLVGNEHTTWVSVTADEGVRFYDSSATALITFDFAASRATFVGQTVYASGAAMIAQQFIAEDIPLQAGGGTLNLGETGSIYATSSGSNTADVRLILWNAGTSTLTLGNTGDVVKIDVAGLKIDSLGTPAPASDEAATAAYAESVANVKVASVSGTSPIVIGGTATAPIVTILAATTSTRGTQSTAHFDLLNLATEAATADTMPKRGTGARCAFGWVAPALTGVATAGFLRFSSESQVLAAVDKAGAPGTNLSAASIDGANNLTIGDDAFVLTGLVGASAKLRAATSSIAIQAATFTEFTAQTSSAFYPQTFATDTTIDWNNGNNQIITLTGNVRLHSTNERSGAHYTLILIQDVSGGHSADWTAFPDSFSSSPAVSSTLGAAADGRDIFLFVSDGSTLYCHTHTVH